MESCTRCVCVCARVCETTLSVSHYNSCKVTFTLPDVEWQKNLHTSGNARLQLKYHRESLQSIYRGNCVIFITISVWCEEWNWYSPSHQWMFWRGGGLATHPSPIPPGSAPVRGRCMRSCEHQHRVNWGEVSVLSQEHRYWWRIVLEPVEIHEPLENTIYTLDCGLHVTQLHLGTILIKPFESCGHILYTPQGPDDLFILDDNNIIIS